ncbi:F-box domain containing protein [Pandoravirus neocaledonia]|uniref:F-box domain containing protein n=1 Tax=Pandoravirus neocaledonia TaxID=2107708 RepID=A0A2U7UCT8_9VIRU|nr:F-box domain containing protein [Pandoravirus neocaledonia]AVK76237.1 F-box domain containing protein [Pandoravirus neocaledonia]
MDGCRMPSSLCARKTKWSLVVGRARRRRVAIKRKCLTRNAPGSDTADEPRLTDLPDELIDAILSHLPGRDLAAAALTCTTLSRVSDAEHMWQAAYRRDIDPDGPPIQHQDHLAYGKSTRWLYGLMRLPEGVLRIGPSGRLTGRLAQPDGITSGEFIAGAPKHGTSSHLLLLDGYGAVARRQPTKWDVDEGFYRGDVKTDRGSWATFPREGPDGRQSRTAVYALRGPIVDGLHHGICNSVWSDGRRKVGEVVGGDGSGRAFCISAGGYAFSGDMDDEGKIRDTGVKRTPDGTLIEYAAYQWYSHSDRSIDLVKRAPCGVTERALPAGYVSKDAGKHSLDYRGGFTAGATVSVDETGNTRIDMGGYVIVANAERVLFIAVDNKHRDRVIAGRRWMANVSDEAKPSKSSDSVVGDLAALAPTRPSACRDISAIVGLSCATRTTLSAILDGAGLESTTPWTEATSVPAVYAGETAATPYGIVLPVDSDTPDAKRHVYCFLTGGVVPAQDCILYSNGRLYDAQQLFRWSRFERHDPETGHPVPAPTGGILWREWMRVVPSHILAYAAADAYNTTVAVDACKGRDTLGVHCSLIRHTAAECMGIALRPGISLMCAAARASAGSRSDDKDDDNNNVDGDDPNGTTVGPGADAHTGPTGFDLLTPGFERITLRHIELRHPEWEPRGKWTFGPPSGDVPDDPTMGDHERQPKGPPDQFVDSHGILAVAFGPGVSFVGARLTGVFFFGQRFECASFVAATLDRCAFVGCTFDDGCDFDRALLSGCRFYRCKNKANKEIEDGMPAKRGAIIL